MNLKPFLSKLFAKLIVDKQKDKFQYPKILQEKILKNLIINAKYTLFGKSHNFKAIQAYEDFKQNVPVRTYEDFLDYIHQIQRGTENVLWPGKPLYFAKTAGTTGGDKYIPVTKESITHHIINARNALLYYIYETGKADFLTQKMIFLSGSPRLILEKNIFSGRLSGIVNHHIPAYIRCNQLPSYETNCISNWESKLSKIVEETLQQNMGVISGIPPWVQMYFDNLNNITGKTIHEIFPNFSLLLHGGVNFEPYRKKMLDSIGCNVDTIETYPASEGFIAYQNSQQEAGLLLQLNSGIFFEFIPTRSLILKNPTRLCIDEVEIGVDYAIVVSTNAGLWGYLLGDTVKFTRLHPYKIIVTGRLKHFISAFGEHVIIEEIEKAMQLTLLKYPTVRVREFTVAPQVSKDKTQKSYHEWLIEFDEIPNNIASFAYELDKHMRSLNSYYRNLVESSILSTLKIISLQHGAFRKYMQKINKLGEQNKVVRVSNNRLIADAISEYKVLS